MLVAVLVVLYVLLCVLVYVLLCVLVLILVVPPALKKKGSEELLDPEGLNVELGDQVLVAGQKIGTVRFYGKTDFAPGEEYMIYCIYVYIYIHNIYLYCLSPALLLHTYGGIS